jgi:uncharacterized membrane protein
MNDERNSGTLADSRGETALEIDMDLLVGYILLIGVLVSLVLVLGALVWRWKETGKVQFDYQITGMNFFEFLVAEISLAVHGSLRPRLLLSLGIIALMLTPFLRVLASMLYFMAALRNWKYSILPRLCSPF